MTADASDETDGIDINPELLERKRPELPTWSTSTPHRSGLFFPATRSSTSSKDWIPRSSTASSPDRRSSEKVPTSHESTSIDRVVVSQCSNPSPFVHPAATRTDVMLTRNRALLILTDGTTDAVRRGTDTWRAMIAEGWKADLTSTFGCRSTKTARPRARPTSVSHSADSHVEPGLKAASKVDPHDYDVICLLTGLATTWISPHSHDSSRLTAKFSTAPYRYAADRQAVRGGSSPHLQPAQASAGRVCPPACPRRRVRRPRS